MKKHPATTSLLTLPLPNTAQTDILVPILKSLRAVAVGTLLSLIIVAPLAQGQTVQTLHSFDGLTGAEPSAGLVLGADGNYYSTTDLGGGSNLGTIFRITPAGQLTTLVTFIGTNGANPTTGLVLGVDGNFYGTTEKGGTNDLGTVFRMTPAGILTTLVTFDGTNGSGPTGLVQANDGNFYGTANGIFQMLPDGTFTVLVTGITASAALVQGTDGDLYGTTVSGGNTADGSAFKVTLDGTFTELASFFYGAPPNHGPANPAAELLQGTDGNFYGTTPNGGVGNQIGNDAGTIFQLTPTGQLTVVVSLNNTNGTAPLAGLVSGGDGYFYGTTLYGGEGYVYNTANFGFGTIFRVTPEGDLTSLFSFNQTDGADPEARLLFGSDGHLYGTTAKGGATDQGTVFRLLVPTLPAPTGLTATAGNNQVVLSWNASAGAATYSISRRRAFEATPNLAAGITGTTFTDTTAINGATYFYVVRAVAGTEQSWPSNEANATPNNPPSVNITSPAEGASFVGPAQITITADAFETDGGTVEQVEFFNGNTFIGSDVFAPYQFTWNNVPAGNYTITARATDNLGGTTTSAPVNITVTAPPPPAAPTNLTARAKSSTQIGLKWTNNAPFAAGFRIEQSINGKPFKEIKFVNVAVTRVTISRLRPATKYSYRVRASNSFGESEYSNIAKARTLP